MLSSKILYIFVDLPKLSKNKCTLFYNNCQVFFRLLTIIITATKIYSIFQPKHTLLKLKPGSRPGYSPPSYSRGHRRGRHPRTWSIPFWDGTVITLFAYTFSNTTFHVLLYLALPKNQYPPSSFF